MELLAELAAFLTAPTTWAGPNSIPTRLLEHIVLSGLSVIIGGLVAVPVGLYIGHTGRAGLLAVSVANIGRAIPSLALLLILFPFFGLSYGLALTALVLLAIPPILTNAYVGLREVDRDLVEAGRGMGMNEPQLLFRVELPAALPVILSGVRTAAVQVVATATLAAFVAGGGLGRYIVDGLARRNEVLLLAGAVLVALLAVLTERLFAFFETRLVSPGIRVDARRLVMSHPEMAAARPPA
ncbi:MAG: ABC transporter permease [Chloroflexi bacterium]|nr:ABC transporter permease [Chloroflexota bacterium]